MGTQFPFPKKGRSPLPNFRPISIVAKRLDASRCHLVWMLASAQGTLFRWRPSLPSPRKGQTDKQTDRQTDGQTDGHYDSQGRASIAASRGKNESEVEKTAYGAVQENAGVNDFKSSAVALVGSTCLYDEFSVLKWSVRPRVRAFQLCS